MCGLRFSPFSRNAGTSVSKFIFLTGFIQSAWGDCPFTWPQKKLPSINSINSVEKFRTGVFDKSSGFSPLFTPSKKIYIYRKLLERKKRRDFYPLPKKHRENFLKRKIVFFCLINGSCVRRF